MGDDKVRQAIVIVHGMGEQRPLGLCGERRSPVLEDCR